MSHSDDPDTEEVMNSVMLREKLRETEHAADKPYQHEYADHLPSTDAADYHDPRTPYEIISDFEAHAADKAQLNLNDIRDEALNMIACGINHTLSPDDEEYVRGQIDWALRQVLWNQIHAADKAQEWRQTNGLVYNGDTFVGRAFTATEANKICDAHNAALTAEREKYRKEMETVTMNTSDIETVQQLRDQLAAAQQPLVDALTRLLITPASQRDAIIQAALAKVKEGVS